MVRDRWSRSDGGVCNNCGEPRLAHDGERCPSEETVAELSEAIEQWHRRVDWAKDQKDRTGKGARNLRSAYKKGWCKKSHLERQEEIFRLAQTQYEAMIRLADEQAESD